MDGKKLLEQLPKPLRDAVGELIQQESKIEAALETREGKLLFEDNPLAFFAKNQIKISPTLRDRLSQFQAQQAFWKKELNKFYLLPNGKVVQPKFRFKYSIK